LSISPIRAPDGSLEAIIGMIVDITERKKSEAEREQLIVELDAFAHTVAHDLQNPLSIVMGYVELLRLDFKIMPDEDIREFLNTIARNSLRMNNIIDELLVLSSVRKLDEVAVGPLDMAQIIAEARERLMLMIEETGAEITFDKPPGEWPVALGYAPWIEEVWANYLSNAIKYGAPTPCPDSDEQPPVPPQIELGAKWDPVQDKVRFWVRDHGPGITPEDQQKLFVQFTRLNGTRAAGHGLGLSIVQRIVARLGGEVGIESAPGVGSTFYFTLPCKN
ncbi:MAG: HAMP domain-containing histidine kinase, partial [Anaerolineae bacterium]|nr:HAMP domain-containing histidine kinase [Anaerolineae bacterium]